MSLTFDDNYYLALFLTILAGLCTGLGGLLILLYKKNNFKFLGLMLGISAGVMLYVSFIEIFFKAKEYLTSFYGVKDGTLYTIVGFFSGIFLIMLINTLIPDKTEQENNSNNNLLRLGILSAIAISIHNFPEGLATFLSTIKDPVYGYSIAFAVAIHNIPEGIAVAIPIYYATKSRKKAFFISLASGLAEPLGAIIGFYFLNQFFSEASFGIIFSATAGIMVYISLNDLIPAANKYSSKNITSIGIIIGMLVMAISLYLIL